MHFGATLSVPKALAWTATVTAAQGLLQLAPWPRIAHITVLAVPSILLAAALTITYRGRTIAGWFVHRRRANRRTPRLAQIISSDNTAILWDHTKTRASVLIEITRKPFTVNILDQDNNWSAPPLDLDVIRHELRQFDIRLNDLTLATVGYTYARQNSLAKIAFTTTGPINAVTYARTYLRITVNMLNSAASIATRQIDNANDPRESLAAGLARTVKIAAARTHRAIVLQGFTATTLSKHDATALHHDLVELLSDTVNHDGFRHAGNDAPHLVAFTPTKDATTRSHADWLRATTEVCAHITRMTPCSDSEDRIEELYCNKVNRLDTVALAEANQLRREYGQHAAIATTALPLAVPPDLTAIPERTVEAGSSNTGMTVMPGGVGIYLGHTTSGTERAWLDITVAANDPLWIVGPAQFAQLILIRSAAIGLRINAAVPELAALAHTLRHNGVGTHTDPDITISTINQNGRHGTGERAAVQMLWSPTPIRQRPRYLIEVTGPATMHVHTPTAEHKLRWECTAAEAALLAESRTR